MMGFAWCVIVVCCHELLFILYYYLFLSSLFLSTIYCFIGMFYKMASLQSIYHCPIFIISLPVLQSSSPAVLLSTIGTYIALPVLQIPSLVLQFSLPEVLLSIPGIVYPFPASFLSTIGTYIALHVLQTSFPVLQFGLPAVLLSIPGIEYPFLRIFFINQQQKISCSTDLVFCVWRYIFSLPQRTLYDPVTNEKQIVYENY